MSEQVDKREHRVRVGPRLQSDAAASHPIRSVVATVTLREALAVLDSALEYADDRMAGSTKTKIRTELAGRLERDARR